jgi:hypothetical protein
MTYSAFHPVIILLQPINITVHHFLGCVEFRLEFLLFGYFVFERGDLWGGDLLEISPRKKRRMIKRKKGRKKEIGEREKDEEGEKER